MGGSIGGIVRVSCWGGLRGWDGGRGVEWVGCWGEGSIGDVARGG